MLYCFEGVALREVVFTEWVLPFMKVLSVIAFGLILFSIYFRELEQN